MRVLMRQRCVVSSTVNKLCEPWHRNTVRDWRVTSPVSTLNHVSANSSKPTLSNLKPFTARQLFNDWRNPTVNLFSVEHRER
jgi:hypothetical protein